MALTTAGKQNPEPTPDAFILLPASHIWEPGIFVSQNNLFCIKVANIPDPNPMVINACDLLQVPLKAKKENLQGLQKTVKVIYGAAKISTIFVHESLKTKDPYPS